MDADLIKRGMPSNTPLMLLVKAGDVEAVNLLLPFYNADELMKTTPRGNSVFHIASITGQGEMLITLRNRAIELNIWNEYREHTNNAGYTAFQMLDALCLSPRDQFFKNLMDFSDPFLGGEEINKAVVSDSGKNKLHMARNKTVISFHNALTKAEETNHNPDLYLR